MRTLRGVAGGNRRRDWVTAVAAVGAAALVAVSAAGPAVAAEAEDPPPLVIAHRGASASAPEHTFAAYDRAVEAHADVLECDLQLTKDGVLVCMHDTTVDRTTGGTASGRVDSFTLAQLRTMDFGSWFGPEFGGASIVPFEEQLRCYRKAAPGIQFYAETKAPAEYGGRMEPRLVALLRRLDLIPEGPADPHTAPVIIQSFDRNSLETVKRLAPTLPAAWLWLVPPAGAPADGSVPPGIDVMAPTAQYVLNQPEMVGEVHASGGDVHTWTVDDPAEMDRLLDAGVDGIFTNDSATLRAHIDARTGHGPRRPVKLAPGCPGIAGTVTAASTNALAGSTGSASRDGATASGPGGHDVLTTGDSSGWITAGVVALVVLVALGIWWLRKRHRSE